MEYLWGIVLLAFVVIGIFKDLHGEYLKRSAVSLMVLCNIGALLSEPGSVYFYLFIHGILLGLFLYLYDAARVK